MGIFDIFKVLGNKNIEVFPTIDSVFDTELEKCKEVFFPVCSIRLGDIRKEWGDEKIHLIQFNEDPYNTDTAKYFNDYCKDNMIAFDLNNGKYRFKTDFGYFDLTEDWKEWFNKTKETYIESKKDFVNNGNDFGIKGLQLGGEPEWWQADETPTDLMATQWNLSQNLKLIQSAMIGAIKRFFFSIVLSINWLFRFIK
ncbi:MAG: hypothetical protein LRY27_03605 [Chitinophagales bacterium]|nr:hypothetical protein [Chitinophagales bacterium]